MTAARIADWPRVRRWRAAERARLLALRQRLSSAERRRASADVSLLLRAEVACRIGGCVALYWPIKGEIDLRELAVRLHEAGVATALPVVVTPGAPLEFWEWGPRTRLRRGAWNIPVPAERRPLQPTAIVVPLLGHDAAGYRLGYGGGYYDRTLATLDPRAVAIGVGHAEGRLATIRPQPHDVPMDAIATAGGITWFRRQGAPVPRPPRPTTSEEASHVR